ncbi:transposase [Streptomyces sp. NBC_01367]|uniref:transposase n=1 Tax=Streptomyces sp. NBC_01367 TaxID=2903841 RepID=UPI003864AFFF
MRGRLEEFASEVFAPLVRRGRLEAGQLYLRGLLLDGRRKSMQPMAERLGVDHQRLQQFMTSSTWPVEDVRARLAWRAVRAVRPEVWVVDDTGFPQDGIASPGVARQYSGTLGPPRWSRTPVTARTPISATASRTGVWPTCCRLTGRGEVHRRPETPRHHTEVHAVPPRRDRPA